MALILVFGSVIAGASAASAGQGGGQQGGGHDGSGQSGYGGGSGHGHGGQGDGGHTGNQCTSYTPTALSISSAEVTPGESVTISGKAVPGTTVVVRIGSTQIGSAVVDAAGNFTAMVTIPASLTPGSYNITVDTPACPSSGCITIVVEAMQECDCQSNAKMVQRSETLTWNLFPDLDHSKSTTLVLVPANGGSSFTLYSGPYPASGHVSVTIPTGAVDGAYSVVETGAKNGAPWSMSCTTWVKGSRDGGGGGGSSTSTSSSSTSSSSTSSTSSTSTTSGQSTTTIAGGHSATTIAGSGGGSSTTTTDPNAVLGETLSRPVVRVGSSTAPATTSVGRSGLAFTGATIRPLILLALGLIALGGLLLLDRRHRRG